MAKPFDGRDPDQGIADFLGVNKEDLVLKSELPNASADRITYVGKYIMPGDLPNGKVIINERTATIVYKKKNSESDGQ